MSVCHLPPLLDCQPRDGGGCWDCSVPGAHAWHSDTRQALTPNCSSLRPAATVLNTPATRRLRPSRAGAAAAPRSSPCQGPSQRLLSSHQVLSQHLAPHRPAPNTTEDQSEAQGTSGTCPKPTNWPDAGIVHKPGSSWLWHLSFRQSTGDSQAPSPAPAPGAQQPRGRPCPHRASSPGGQTVQNPTPSGKGDEAGPPASASLRRQALSRRDFVLSDEEGGLASHHGRPSGRDRQYLLGGRGWSQGCSGLLSFPLFMFEVPSFWRHVTICPFLGSFLVALCAFGLCGRCRHLPIHQRSRRDGAPCGLPGHLSCPRLISLRLSVPLDDFGVLFGILRDNSWRFRGL